MESVLFIIAMLLAAVALVVLPIIHFFGIILAIANYLGLRDWYNRKLFFQKTDPVVNGFLEKHFKYYQQLHDEEKITFIRRVQKFRDLKTFEGREGLEVTGEMEALVSAAAIQITFGFPSLYFKKFDRIILYPDNYFSTVAGNYHKGEVHTGGVIVLSWKNLADGYLNYSDGRNLGLHEMAHALRITDYTPGRQESDFLDPDALIVYREHAHYEMEKIASGESTFFRQYASANEHEFFAIAVENFFERPEEFLNYNPELMRVMERLLNQSRPVVVA